MISKKVVIILIIIAIILAAVSISYRLIYSAKNVSTAKTGEGNLEDTGQGNLGVIISPPPAEDKNEG